ncbi:uncharacterized protein LOC132714713 [Ruditapes philippinarum]|uniref:uncharacterized protein LOC132714713 n=1 Tax=Ruditapes philippinarum TaxID=129788 RepID=UPI00295B3014|nr:uncharacterized protein LOC132714713 [Ruditapes philippinarum]
MVGHTHEDIDAVFSRIGKQLRQTNAPTLGKLHQAISICMEPAPIVNHFSSVLDYRSKCLESDTRYSGFQGVHHFTFKMDQDRLQMKYKDWPSDEYSKLDMTDCVGKLDFRFVPNASLNEKVLNVKECLSKDLEKYGQAGRMEVDDQEWWAAYLNGIERACRMPPITPGICQLPKFKEANGTRIVSNTLTALRDHQKNQPEICN